MEKGGKFSHCLQSLKEAGILRRAKVTRRGGENVKQGCAEPPLFSKKAGLKNSRLFFEELLFEKPQPSTGLFLLFHGF